MALVLLILLPGSAWSQRPKEIKSHSGFEAGYSHHFITAPHQTASTNNLETLPGYHVYLFRQQRITKHAGIQIAAGWTQRIYRYTDDIYFNTDRQQDIAVNRYLHHLTVPVTLVFQIKSWCWHAGVYREWPLASDADPNANATRPNFPESKDYGIIAGSVWQLGPIGFFARYLYGLTDHVIVPFPDETGKTNPQINPHYQTIQAGIRVAVF
ncbi:MAG: hypothetical protein R2806_23405 [Saprospiraceae bacterium]